ncbi:hypothetical protein ACFV0B_30895 [Streptomyces xanthophaeus]|uniref:hypothetical protein n=1 Tax=Streptomyces xanthophaeus TaxID=67385 RepID=UPI00367DF312
MNCRNIPTDIKGMIVPDDSVRCDALTGRRIPVRLTAFTTGLEVRSTVGRATPPSRRCSPEL